MSTRHKMKNIAYETTINYETSLLLVREIMYLLKNSLAVLVICLHALKNVKGSPCY